MSGMPYASKACIPSWRPGTAIPTTRCNSCATWASASVLFEASALLEVNFFKYRGLAKDSRSWTPFVFAGLGYFHTNPQNLLNDTWYDLQPLGTEGQGTGNGAGYGLNQCAFPSGWA
jgi:hypothetical protein